MSEPSIDDLVLPYGTIVGDGARVLSDGADPNPHPDVRGFDEVRVTFTPSDGNGRRVNTVIWTGADGPTILYPQPEVARFVDGRLVLDMPTPPQPDGMRLMATVSDDMVPNSWGWKMEWQNWPGGKGPGPVIFPLTPGETVDIAEALAGYLDEVPAVDFDNLLAAADEVMQARAEVQQISGLTGEDDAVAFLVDSDTTTTGQAVRAVAGSTPAPATDESVAGLVQGDTATRAALGEIPLTASDASVASLVATPSSDSGAAVRDTIGRVNARDHGAVGDGSTNDRAALADAIAAAASAGRDLYIPSGNFAVDGTLTIPSGLRVRGDASGGTRITQTADLSTTLRLPGAKDVDIRDLTIHGKTTDYVNNSSVLAASGVYISGDSSNITIANCRLLGMAGAGVRLSGTAVNITVRDCTMTGAGPEHITSTSHGQSMGVAADGVSLDGLRIVDCDISGFAQGVLMPDSSTSTQIVGNRIHDIPGQHGLYLASGNGLLITGNIFRDIALQGVKLQIGTTASADIDTVIISDNEVIGTGSHGILLDNPVGGAPRLRRVIVSDCIIRNAGECGIIAQQVVDLRVGDCIITAAGKSGIRAAASGSVEIADCTIRDAAYDGIEIASASDFTVRDNRIHGAGSANVAANKFGIHVSGSSSDGMVTGNRVTADAATTMRYGIFVEGGDLSTISIIGNAVSGAQDYGYRGLNSPAKNFAGNMFMGALGGMLTPPVSGEGWPFRELFAASAPAAGAHRVGDRCWNSAPAAGGALGWICTAAGNPGTWKPFGAIAT